MRLPPENTTHSAVRPTEVRLRGASGKARVWEPIWSSMLLMNWSSGTMLCTKSFAGSVNWERGCFTSIFSERCTNVPAPCREGYQRAFSLSRSARAASIPLSAIFRLRLPFCICLRASPKLRGREVCAATPPMASSTQAAAGKNLRHNRLFISSFGLGVLVSLNKRRWELFSSHLFE